MKKKLTIFPPGKYWIGDPIYLDGEDYGATYRMQTEYGDGVYFDQRGHGYPVSGGELALVPSSNISNKATARENGRFVVFNSAFMCDYHKGKFTFGHIVIETGDPT